jgi:hypothetical protein
MTHRVIEIAPLRTRFYISVPGRVSPVLKKLKGYQSESATPE